MTKTHEPTIKYLAPSPQGYLIADKTLLDTPMRISRLESGPGKDHRLSYDHYFKGITQVLSKNHYKLLAEAVANHLKKDALAEDIEEVRIYAEKHGSDYHPARIEVSLGDVCVCFVMNVAATARGKDRLCREFDALRHLNSKYGYPYLPQAYFKGEASCSSGPAENGETSFFMFLADWFDGYHEFHLSVDKKSGAQKVVVWDTAKGNCYLSGAQAFQTYKQAAKILTLCYDIESFEQIFPWHHAAGDFIVKQDKDSLDLKLVTARQYAPMIESSEEIPAYDALLFFLLNLSLRMRLDRLDGVGDVAWADDDCVDATLDGFLEGLRKNEEKEIVDGRAADSFLQFCHSLDKEDLSDMFHALVDACDQAAPDIPVIRTHLENHTWKFHTSLQGLCAS